MLTREEYIRHSIETNLFFLRIMKEHLIFTAAALTPKDATMIPSIMELKDKFEQLLAETVSMANGVVRPQSLAAGDIVTHYTYNAEVATQNFTGLPINTNITRMEAALVNSTAQPSQVVTEQSVNSLNQRAMTLVTAAIQAKKMIRANVLSCKMFTHIYPLMLDHVIREAEHYLQHLHKLQNRQSLVGSPKEAALGEMFWNDIMGEHAKFIRGLLDPTQEELIQRANGFAGEFDALTRAARQAYDQLPLLPEVTRRSTNATINIRNLKQQGTLGILECKIRSIILPLLSDHVLREANHYLKELREFR